MQTTRKRILGCILILGGLLLCAAGVRLLTQPEMYRASARVRVVVPDRGELTLDPSDYVDFVRTELHVIQSETNLGKVVEVLGLASVWAERFGRSGKLTTFESVAILKSRTSLRRVSNTVLVDICIVSETPAEAAMIANAVAEAYQRYWNDRLRELNISNLKSLEERAKEQEEKIRTTSENLEALQKELGLPSVRTQSPELKAQYRKYTETKSELEDMKDFLRLLNRKIELEKGDLQTPNSAPVEIIERAIPPMRPASPNGPIRAALVLASLLTGFVVIGFGILLVRRPLLFNS